MSRQPPFLKKKKTPNDLIKPPNSSKLFQAVELLGTVKYRSWFMSRF